jgi:hypothetical protein
MILQQALMLQSDYTWMACIASSVRTDGRKCVLFYLDQCIEHMLVSSTAGSLLLKCNLAAYYH